MRGSQHYWLRNKWAYQCKTCCDGHGVEHYPGDLETGRTERQCRYFKAKVLEDHKAEGTDQMLKKTSEGEKSIVFSDKSTSYINIADDVSIHMTEKSSERRQRKH